MATIQPYSMQRRSTRIQFGCRVKIRGLDPAGNIFTEETETVSISKHGACLNTANKYKLGQVISIRTINHDQVGQFQVVWVGEPGTAGEGRIGVEWMDVRKFWGIEFPPEDWGSE